MEYEIGKAMPRLHWQDVDVYAQYQHKNGKIQCPACEKKSEKASSWHYKIRQIWFWLQIAFVWEKKTQE